MSQESDQGRHGVQSEADASSDDESPGSHDGGGAIYTGKYDIGMLSQLNAVRSTLQGCSLHSVLKTHAVPFDSCTSKDGGAIPKGFGGRIKTR
jgi:hypothetical protein